MCGAFLNTRYLTSIPEALALPREVSMLLIPTTHSAFGLLVLGAILGLGLGAVVPSLTAYAASSVSNEKELPAHDRGDGQSLVAPLG